MGKLYKKYKDYQLFNEIMGDEEPDTDSGNGCLTVIFIVFAAVIIISLFN